MAQDRSPQVVVMDIILGQMNGIEATRRIKATLPAAQVVMLTICEGEVYRTDAATAGASAYVLKRRMRTELLPTLAALLASQQEPVASQLSELGAQVPRQRPAKPKEAEHHVEGVGGVTP